MRGTTKAPFTRSIATTFAGRRTRFGIAAALLLAVVGLALTAFASADPKGEGTFYKEGLRGAAIIRNVAPGPDGNVWFVDNPAASGISGLGKITPGGAITEYLGGTNLSGLNPESFLDSIVAGPGGSKYLWFTDRGTTPAIGVIDSASPETATEFSIEAKGGNAGSKPKDIAVGPEGDLWFTDEGTTPAIGVAVLGSENEIEKIEEFSTGLNAGARPLGIVAGPDGNLWFTDQGTTTAVGKIDPESHAIEEFTIPSGYPGGSLPEYGPYGIVAGPDGNVWFTEAAEPSEKTKPGLCRVLTSGEVGKVSCFDDGLLASSGPEGLTVAADGKLWFADESGVSEQQLIEITDSGGEEALKGTYKLSFEGQETGGTGSGNLLSKAKGKGDVKRYPTTGNATCTRTISSKELTSCNNEPSVKAEVGMFISGTGIPAETTITKIEGTTITISNPASSSGSSTNVQAGRIIKFEPTENKVEVGQPITGTGIATSTFVLSFEEEEGKVVRIVPNKAPSAVATGSSLSFGAATTTKTVVTNVTTSTGTFVKGETITSEAGGIPASTTITAINTKLKTLTLSAAPTKEETAALSTALAYNASPTVIGEALEALSTIPAGTMDVGNAGAFPVKRPVTFTGSLKFKDISEEIVCNGAGLDGTASCTVTTATQGVPTAVGCMTVGGKSCGRYPFAELYGGPAGITYMSGENVWLAGGVTTSTTLGKVGTECVENCPPTNLRTLTMTKSANGPGGTGTVSSKPKGIKCGTVCPEAVARLYKEQEIVLTAKPTLTSAFVEWQNAKEGGACDGSTNPVCTVPKGNKEDISLEAIYSGTAKTITPAKTLTVSKGESEESRGKGTVKASGLVCEAECQETKVLYQGPVTEPKVKPGKVVILKQAPAFGSEFLGWTGCTEISETECEVKMESDKEVVAEYAAKPNKVLTVNKAYGTGYGTVSSKPKGIKCATACTQAVANMPEDAKVELLAKPGLETTFVEWVGGDCNGSTNPVCIVEMNVDETTKAVFSKGGKAFLEGSEPTLTLEKEGLGQGTVKAAGLTCEVLCTSTSVLFQGPVELPKPKAGKVVILKAASAPGSTTVAWSGCTPIGETECEVKMESSKEVIATFEELK